MTEHECDELDHAVAKALGGELDGDGWRFDQPLAIYGSYQTFIKTKRSFCRDWEYGGPIIEREGIAIYRNYLRDASGRFNGWIAAGSGQSVQQGETPLIAAMRAFVATPRSRPE